MSNILVVDDHPANRDLFATVLGYGGHHVIEASDGPEALERARSEIPDLIISDILMPIMDGFTLARRIRTDPLLAKVPIIFQTAHYLTEEVRRLALECDVRHILSKPIEPENLLHTVDEALAHPPTRSSSLPNTREFTQQHLQLLADKLYQKVTELEQANIRLHRLSLTDELTGINNRRGFMIHAEELLKFARRAGYQLCLLYLDVDHLKHINDTFGHAAGDAALRDAARILTGTFRQSDIIARLGGDEFGVLALDTTGSHVETIQSRLQSNLDAHNAQTDHGYVLSLSLGMIHVDLKSNLTTEELLAQADAALYLNKQQKRNHKPEDKLS
jgi:diguanylate cyclase (GGDEF)-like protein